MLATLIYLGWPDFSPLFHEGLKSAHAWSEVLKGQGLGWFGLYCIYRGGRVFTGFLKFTLLIGGLVIIGAEGYMIYLCFSHPAPTVLENVKKIFAVPSDRNFAFLGFLIWVFFFSKSVRVYMKWAREGTYLKPELPSRSLQHP